MTTSTMQATLLTRLSAAHTTRKHHQKEFSFWLNLHDRLCTDLHNDRNEIVSLHNQRNDKTISKAEFKALSKTVRGRGCRAEVELEWLRETMFKAVRKRYEADREVDGILVELDELIEKEKTAVVEETVGGCEESVMSNELDKAIAKHEALDKAVKNAEKVERLAKLQYRIAETELEYAEEVECAHWRIWKAERVLSLGTADRDRARASFELARENFRAAKKRLGEMDHVKMEAIIARLEAEGARIEEGREGKKLKEIVDSIPSISVGDVG